jgi:pre-rRNA-processing protein TSR3
LVHSLPNNLGWGHAFYEINSELFAIYSSCSDSADVVRAQNEYLLKMEQEIAEKKENKSNELMQRNQNHRGLDLSEEDSQSDVEEIDQVVLKFDKLGNTIVE